MPAAGLKVPEPIRRLEGLHRRLRAGVMLLGGISENLLGISLQRRRRWRGRFRG